MYIIWSFFVYDSMPSSLNEFWSRYISISNPLSSVDIARQRRRARLKEIVKQIWQITCYGHHFKSSFIFRLLVGIAWALTVVLASPQAIIWRVLKHPDIQPDFYQVSRDAKSDELGEPVHAIFQFILFPPQSVLILKKAILALVLGISANSRQFYAHNMHFCDDSYAFCMSIG